MKQVILIGKFNEITREIRESLSTFCRVQLCSDNADAARGMVRMVHPDMAVVSLVGSLSSHEDIFTLMFREFPEIPILAVGTEASETELQEAGFLADDRVRFIKRPLKLDEIIRQTHELLERSKAVQPAEEEAKAPPSRNAPEGKKTILLVDDNPSFLRMMQSMLTPTYRVRFATSGPQALAVIARGTPDLILLDYEMPVCDGKMTLQMLRAEDATKDIPVVFLTGMADADHVQELLSLLPNDYLLKPPSEERLYATIENILGRPADADRRRI